MILLLDNYDSFTYNVAHSLGELGFEVKVVRSDAISPDEVEKLWPEAIFISPGPGKPSDHMVSCRVIERFAGQIPIMGVCLGHQAIAEVFGARVVRAQRQVHGKTSDIFHDGKTLYRGLRNPFVGARYHSLIVPEESVGSQLEVAAYTQEGEVMGLRCPGLAVEGVQFHPESIATRLGSSIFKNFIDNYLVGRKAA